MRIINRFSDYAISECGAVYSFKNHKRVLMSPVLARGYLQVGLRSDLGQRKHMKIHRLVAITYIENPEKKPIINHIDGNKLNNHVSNLSWCTVRENTQHAFDTGLAKKGNDHYAARLILDSQSGVFYYSVGELATLYGLKLGTLYAMLSGKNNNYTPFTFV